MVAGRSRWHGPVALGAPSRPAHKACTSPKPRRPRPGAGRGYGPVLWLSTAIEAALGVRLTITATITIDEVSRPNRPP